VCVLLKKSLSKQALKYTPEITCSLSSKLKKDIAVDIGDEFNGSLIPSCFFINILK